MNTNITKDAVSAIELEIVKLVEEIPAVFASGIIQSIPRSVESGVYAGWLKFKLFFELLTWAVSADNPEALGIVVGIANQWTNEVESIMTHVSGSAILKALENSSTVFETSRKQLDDQYPLLVSLGFNPSSQVTTAAVKLATKAVVAPSAKPVAPKVAAPSPVIDITDINVPDAS